MHTVGPPSCVVGGLRVVLDVPRLTVGVKHDPRAVRTPKCLHLNECLNVKRSEHTFCAALH